MSIPVRVPSASEDRPRWAVLAAIAVVCAAMGIGLARWGTYGRHDAARSVEPSGEIAGEADVEAEPAITEREAAEVEPEPAIAEPEAAPAIVEAEPAIVEAEPAIVEAEPEPEPPAAATAPSTPPPQRPATLRIVRGRVAYLRCEGVPQRSGPVPCPRDESLEAAAWAAIDALASCAALPAREGEADVVIDFASASAAPEVRARDTFASDVVQLEAAPVVACLAPTLGAVRQTMRSSRLVASFRFAARAR